MILNKYIIIHVMYFENITLIFNILNFFQRIADDVFVPRKKI